ncbi:TIGR04283 family arsenosugar biosynthesis glycosyltransferase [Ramlibacter sp. AN1015]|uniref:TIGR04283 family arsenosugar biosynthesis glycosyltransferase n=1 Tax=Ramlibacter sp. AN1015 TaxID=3133428 RepID=UPI0030C21028
MISVVVPVRNEAALVQGALAALRAQACSVPVELIVVDGGSTDATAARAAQVPGVRCLHAAPGRARQMNAGAAAARGELLLFLHVDTRLAPGALQMLAAATAQGLRAGAFRHRFSHPDWRLRLISRGHNLKCRLTGIYYGDHGMFVARELFESLGGFPEVDILEDVIFCERLRRHARGRLLEAEAVTDARRFLQQGIWRTTARGLLILARHRLGLTPGGRGFSQEVR